MAGMKVNVIGAGPAGLYAAISLKRARPDVEIRVFERSTPGATFGFGVVFSDQALDFLRVDDPETADLIEPHLMRWSNIVLNHRDERIEIDGVGFAGVGRLELLNLLRSRAADLGVRPEYETPIRHIDDLQGADLVVGADGMNSIVRAATPEAFGERVEHLENRFVWYGAEREFDALTQTFVETPHGPMNAHHYSYAPGRATFIIEMGPETFERSGFGRMTEPEYRAACEKIFAKRLRGAALIPNNSAWRRFSNLRCDTWSHRERVLVGDALHTAHFSIGSGTRLAIEDVIALTRALRDSDWDVAAALPDYQAARQPILSKITAAARLSADWYENFGAHMALDPWPFALSYIRRAGRLDGQRLRRLAPAFTASLDAKGVDLEAS